MAGGARADGPVRGWRLALWALGALTALRVGAILVSPLELYTDEAQYWLWGEHPAFGYYSKPPLIGWLIGAVTALLGDHAWAVRMPAPLLHAATAVLVGIAAGRIDAALAAPALLAYATAPMTALGSFVISTDTAMLPFLAAALALWLPRPGPARALAAGLCVGAGLLAKYAAIYAVLGAALAALLVPALRPSGRAALLAGAGVLLGVLPNVLWNVRQGFVTLRHTAGNAGVEDGTLDFEPMGSLRFLAEQFGVLGPVLMGAVLVAGLGALLRPQGPRTLLAALALLPVALVTAQAATASANANWAVAGYGAGAILAALALPRPWRGVSLGINGAISALMLVLAAAPGVLPPEARERLLGRYEHRAAVAEAVVAVAAREDLATVAAAERGLLADLFWAVRDGGPAARSVPFAGPPPHHYALAFPLEADRPALLALRELPACAEPLEVLRPERGAHRGRTIALGRAGPGCVP